jgi:cytosine/adenosine deaminase-related metal-dependent hydrolase
VGTLADCQAAAPGVTPTDLGGTVLMPGFIEAHSHPALTADTPPASTPTPEQCPELHVHTHDAHTSPNVITPNDANTPPTDQPT